VIFLITAKIPIADANTISKVNNMTTFFLFNVILYFNLPLFLLAD
jgi:hypothetical protein